MHQKDTNEWLSTLTMANMDRALPDTFRQIILKIVLETNNKSCQIADARVTLPALSRTAKHRDCVESFNLLVHLS